MEQTSIPFCEPPPSDVIPMLAVAAVFLLSAITYRWWRNRHAARRKKK